MGNEEQNQLFDELQLMSDFNHNTIMKVYEYAFDPRTNQLFIVLEDFIGRPLFDKLRDEGVFSEDFVKMILR